MADQTEIEFPAVDIDMRNGNSKRITESEGIVAAASRKRVSGAVKMVIVIGQ